PELCDLLIARTTISKEIDKNNIYKGQWQGVKDCFDNWWLILRCSWIGGVIASESSNNAKEGGALVPTVAFGVPGSATMAILLGAFLIHGLVPGPDML